MTEQNEFEIDVAHAHRAGQPGPAALAIARPTAPALWEQQPGETAKAHAAFLLYRNQPKGNRSAEQVGLELGKSRGLMERWRSQHQWVSRAKCWDEEALRDEDGERLEQIKTTNAAIHEACTTTRNKTVAALHNKDFDEMSVAELIALFESANKADRAALGMDSPGVRGGATGGNGPGVAVNIHYKCYQGFDPSEI